jgi:hypothetical protein
MRRIAMSEAVVTSKYTFVCDPDECDTMFEVTTSDGFGFPSGITQLKCPCGRDTTYVSFKDSTSLDVQRDSQPTERSNTMETITEATESPKVLVDEIKQQIATLEAQVNTLRDTLTRERARVRDLYTSINDDIESNDWTEEDTISLKELSDYLESAFTSQLVFTKEYEAFVEFTVKTTVKYRSENAESAQEIADSIGLDLDDDDVNYDGDAEISELYVENTRVLSVEEQ